MSRSDQVRLIFGRPKVQIMSGPTPKRPMSESSSAFSETRPDGGHVIPPSTPIAIWAISVEGTKKREFETTFLKQKKHTPITIWAIDVEGTTTKCD